MKHHIRFQALSLSVLIKYSFQLPNKPIFLISFSPPVSQPSWIRALSQFSSTSNWAAFGRFRQQRSDGKVGWFTRCFFGSWDYSWLKIQRVCGYCPSFNFSESRNSKSRALPVLGVDFVGNPYLWQIKSVLEIEDPNPPSISLFMYVNTLLLYIEGICRSLLHFES